MSALTAPDPRAIVLGDTRPPERQGSSLCKGKAEREPANHRGSREFYQGKRSRPGRGGIRDMATGSNASRLACLLATSASTGCGCYGTTASGGRLTARKAATPTLTSAA